MATFDDVMKQLAELQTTVAGRAGDATIDWNAIEPKFVELVDGVVSKQLEDKLQDRPLRRIPGQVEGPDGETVKLSEMRDNRYFGMLKDFALDGKHRYFARDMQPVDLWFAKRILEEQHRLHHAKMAGPKPNMPSNDLEMAVKLMTSTGAGVGDELVPTEMATQLWEDIFLQSRIVSDIGPLPMPTNPFDVPLGLGQPTWRKGTEGSATTASDTATGKSTLTVTELITEQNWSYTLDEDAVVAMAPQIRSRLTQSGAEIIDDFALNADATNAATGNINLDDADPADDSYYLSDGQDGINHLWIVDNTSQSIDAGGDALTDADVLNALDAMGKYAVNPAQVRMVPDISTYLKALLGSTNVTTVDKFGPEATILTGQLGAYRGIPIILSESMRKAEADGKLSTTAGNNTLGRIAFYNRLLWYVGFRRELLIELDRNIQTRQYIMVTSLREAIAAHGTRASATHTAGIRNILLT